MNAIAVEIECSKLVDVEKPMLVKIYGTGRPVSIMPK
jgi:hypothetical protein